MDDAKRRAAIRSKAAKRRAAIRSKAVKNKETDVGAMGMGSSRPLAKRPMPKVDRAPKK